MKIAGLIARLLLGVIFTVFGLNGFFHFIPMPPPTGNAALFFTAVSQSHFMAAVFAVQVVGGVLLLLNRYVPFALAILGPVVFNILDFHFTMAPEGLPLALITAALWAVVFARERWAFNGLFTATGKASAAR